SLSRFLCDLREPWPVFRIIAQQALPDADCQRRVGNSLFSFRTLPPQDIASRELYGHGCGVAGEWMGCILLFLPEFRISQHSTKITLLTKLTAATQRCAEPVRPASHHPGLRDLSDQFVWRRVRLQPSHRPDRSDDLE